MLSSYLCPPIQFLNSYTFIDQSLVTPPISEHKGTAFYWNYKVFFLKTIVFIWNIRLFCLFLQRNISFIWERMNVSNC